MSDEPYDFATEFQAVFIPKQKPPPEPIAAAEMGATLSSYPPLGQVTQLKSPNVFFTVLLEIEDNDAQKPWEVALWHSSDDGEWSETALSPAQSGQAPSSLQSVKPNNTRLYFKASLSISSCLNFTLKFRNGPDEPWKWARDEQSMGDGTIIVNTQQSSAPGDFSQIVKDLNPNLNIQPRASQAPGTKLWSIEAPIGPANGEDSTYADLPLGVPWGGFLR